MQTGYYNSAAGMVTQFNRLDNIANNLANVNTLGFKEDRLIVGNFSRILQEKRDELPNENQTKEAAKFLNRALTKAPRVVDAYTDFSVGTLSKTTNRLDFALTKPGLFFALKTPEGVRLTRDGSFTLDEDGKLINQDGYEVLSQEYTTSKDGIVFGDDERIIKVDKNGNIYANVPGTANMIPKSNLLIVEPKDLKELKKVGDNLYALKDPDQFNSIEQSGAVKQGFIEKSNVNAVKMMTQLIETNRLIGMYQKAMDTQMNEMNKDAIDKIASNK